MLRRKVYDELVAWRGRPDRRPLLVCGPRQVGKTTIIRHFAAENYDNVVEFDLGEDREVHRVFDGDLYPDTIIRGLSLFTDPDRLVPGSTLVFLDEIQECPRARTALRHLANDRRFDLIASCPLSGADLPGKGDGVPGRPSIIGPEERLVMHGLDFEEFLWAMKVDKGTIDYVRGCIRDTEPIDEAVLSRFGSLFRDHMIVGGMPEAVRSFRDTGGYTEPNRIKDRIIGTWIADMDRCNRGADRVKTVDCFRSIPTQLSQSNKKFMYSRVGGDGSRRSAERYMRNLLWIEAAGYGDMCRMLESPEPPLRGMERRDRFKLHLPDTGLLMNMYGPNAMRAIYSKGLSFNMGAVAENVVAECLRKNGIRPTSYRKNNGPGMMELDFVFENTTGVTVLEVKSGKSRDAPSVRKASMFPQVNRRIVLAGGDVSAAPDGIVNLPLFAAAFIRETDPPWDGPEF